MQQSTQAVKAMQRNLVVPQHHGYMCWILSACSLLLIFRITFLLLGNIETTSATMSPPANNHNFPDTANGNDTDYLFDIMAVGWVPAHCYKSVIADKYLALHSWKYYADPESKTQIPFDTMKTGEYTHIWTSTAFNIAHCLYIYDRQLIAKDDDLSAGSEVDVARHTGQCRELSTNQETTQEAVLVEIEVEYFSCSTE